MPARGMAFAHTRIGRSWIDDNKFDYAEASCQAATTLDANSSIAHVYCGDMYTKKGDSRSLQHYQRAVALAPNNASVLISLANHYYATGDSGKGASAFDRARKISPGSRSIYLNWGNWLHSSNDHAGALQMYDAAIRVYPANDEAYAARVKPLQQLGMTLEAERSESKAKAIRARRNALLSPSNSSTLLMVEPYSRLRTPILP